MISSGKGTEIEEKKWRNDEYVIFHLWNDQNTTSGYLDIF